MAGRENELQGFLSPYAELDIRPPMTYTFFHISNLEFRTCSRLVNATDFRDKTLQG